MKCAWDSLIRLLPPWMRPEVDGQGRETLQELRARSGKPLQMILKDEIRELSHTVSEKDISFIINTASAYSPWAAATISEGYLTAEGGHRIGICGSAVVKQGAMTGFRNTQSLCIRIARDFPGLALSLAQVTGSVLILGPPGSGKTTLLRDLIRQKSILQGKQITVVDERRELFPISGNQYCFDTGPHTDIISGCPKALGIETALRNMSPEIIAMDEITAEKDCEALRNAGWSGVDLFATAHAGAIEDLQLRPVYQMLVQNKSFSSVVILRKDKTWKVEMLKE